MPRSIADNPLFDRFDQIANDAFFWLMQAQLLMRASFLLLAQYELSFTDAGTTPTKTGGRIILDEWKVIDHTLHLPILMLAGMALEAILKGAIIKKMTRKIKKGEKEYFGLGKKAGHGHKLLLLAKQAGISLSVNDEQILNMLEHFIVWKGKYPVSWNEALYDRPNIENFGGTYISQIMINVADLYHSAKSLISPGSGRTVWHESLAQNN